MDANYIESSFINKYSNLLESMGEKLKKMPLPSSPPPHFLCSLEAKVLVMI